MTIEQRLDSEREDRRHEGTLARLGGRRKFTGCPICGSEDGMSATPGIVLALLDAETIAQLAPWYREPGNHGYLFHACDRCNRRGTIPLVGYERVRIIDIPNWLDNADSMAPDYEALAAEPEPWSRITDSRESAGI